MNIMNEINKDRDRIVKTHLNSKLETLIDLEKELKNENYETFSQVMGHIHNSVEFQKKFNKEKGV